MYDCLMNFFVFKQKTSYEMRISYCSSDVCSAVLAENRQPFFVPKGLQGIDGPDLIALWHANPRLRWTCHEAPVRQLNRYFDQNRNKGSSGARAFVPRWRI